MGFKLIRHCHDLWQVLIQNQQRLRIDNAGEFADNGTVNNIGKAGSDSAFGQNGRKNEHTCNR